MKATGAEILVQSLLDQGVEVIFGYPGGAVLNIYDALYARKNELRHVLVSHEQGGAFAADGYARSTGKTGVVLATSGPGATNLVTGIATAYHDSVPLVAITGNVSRDALGRDSFQEIDIVGISNAIVKHNYLIKRIEDLAPAIREAFTIANSGRKGPVLIDIPKDITAETMEFTSLPRFQKRAFPEVQQHQLEKVATLLMESKKPLFYVGGGVTFTDAPTPFLELAETLDVPVVSSLTGLSAVPSNHPLSLGLVGMHGSAAANQAVVECDVLFVAGARFSDRVAGDRKGFAGNATVIHLDVDQAEISKNVKADVPLVGDATECIRQLLGMVEKGSHPRWRNYLAEYRSTHKMPSHKSKKGNLNPREIITQLGKIMGEDGIVATDVGQHQMFAAQYYPFSKPRSFLSSCGLGTMGYGMGAANGAKVGNPNRPVALVTGDGSFHMNMNEFAVAVTEQLPIVVVVFQNQVLGMVHQWQGLFYKEQYAYTELNRHTDFVALAKAMGGEGFSITESEEIAPVLTEAFACGKPCVVACAVRSEEEVYPIIPPGHNGEHIILQKG